MLNAQLRWVLGLISQSCHYVVEKPAYAGLGWLGDSPDSPDSLDSVGLTRLKSHANIANCLSRKKDQITGTTQEQL